MDNVMLDLETLSSCSNAAIVSIGAVCFDIEKQELGKTFYQTISIDTSLEHGCVSGSTIAWWMQQSGEARKVFDQDKAISLTTALGLFSSFMQDGEERSLKVWGNGSSFDNVILANAFESTGLTAPWKFRNNRDMRTIVGLAKHWGIVHDIKRECTHHNALDDAIFQTEVVTSLIHRMKMMALTREESK